MRYSEREILTRRVQRQAALNAAVFNGKPTTRTPVPLWVRATAWMMSVVMYLSPLIFLADQTAQAAPIVDPRAPIPFQPSITQTSTGIPAVNISSPNANGISVNQYQSFGVDSQGLVLNNSLISGTPLLGGTLGANPNLAGRAASTIINQVTSTGPASSLVGPLEVFGSPATVIVSNPNGVSVNGLALTNAPGLVLTTGTPQFLTTVGGSAASFANAGSVAFTVNSGNITINGPAGNNGTPGAGIEGTVGNIDIIAQTVNLNAPLLANQRVNIITGNQTVMPVQTGASGASYQTSSVQPTNLPPGSFAVDANQYGSVTSGQVYIVSTAAGQGVNTLGALSATAGNVVVSSNGDITTGSTFANQNINLASTGNTTVNGTGLANQNYTVAASGDINAPGSVSAGQNVTMTAGGNLSAASVSANGAANLTAGQSMTIGALSAHDIGLQTTNGDLTVGGLSAPGTVSAKAGRDLTVNGQVHSGGTTTLAGGRNATVNAAVASVGDTTLTATSGTATVNGNVQSNGALSVSAGQNVVLGGAAQAQGQVSVTAQSGSITGQGNFASSQGAATLHAGQAIQLTGSVQSGSTIDATAGTNAAFGGTVTAPGAVSINGGGNTALGGNVASGGVLTVASGGSTTLQGTAGSVGNMNLSAATGTLSTTGNVTSLGALAANGQQGVNLGGAVASQGNATIGSSAGSVAVAGTLTSPGTITITAGQDATVSGSVHSGQSTSVNATRDANLNGGLEVDGSGNASVQAGRNITGSGAVNVANNTTLTAGNNVAITGAIQTGNALSATAGNALSVGATTAVGAAMLTATNGSTTLAGNALSGGAMQVTAGTDVNAQGSVQSLGNLGINAKSGNLTATGPVSTAGTANLNAGQNVALNSQTTISKDATLTGTNITTQGVAVGGNLTATAGNNLDMSAGQLNQPFSASAPALSVNGNATLTGANVTTANAVVGGTTQITGTQSLTTGGTAAYQGNATLSGGTVRNVGTQMAAGNLNVSGSMVTNTGALSSLKTTNVNATTLSNSGTIYGPTNALTVTGATTNSGGLLATNALTLSTNSLNNSGLIFAGDVSHPTAPTGNTTVTVSGGNGSFNNQAGQILGQNSATLNLPNQSIDPSLSTYGTVNGGNALNLSAQAISNSGTWTLPGTAVTVSANQGINNAGTINQGAGSLALNGVVTNAGTVNSHDLTINGALVNQTGGTVMVNDALTLNGSGKNAGTVQAANTLTVAGSSYDNSNGITRAGNSSSPAGSGNASFNLTGDLVNAGGTLTATNNLSITAANVNNSGTSSSVTTTTTTTVQNSALLMALVVGTSQYDVGHWFHANEQCCLTTTTTHQVTLADLLSPDGLANIGTYWLLSDGIAGDPQISASPPVTTSGSATFVQVGGLWYIQTAQNAGMGPTKTVALPTVTETTTTTGGTSNASSVIAAGNDLNLTANTLNNQSGTVSAGHNANLNLQSLNNGGSTYTSSVTDAVDTTAINAMLSQLPSSIAVWSTYYGPFAVNNCMATGGACIDPSGIQLAKVGTVIPTSTSSSLSVQGATGQILAGNNLNLSGGNLTNAGSLAAGNDVNVTSASFTNQGSNIGSKTVTAGCAPGYSGCNPTTTNPNSETYSYQQTNASVVAGHDLTIASNQVTNTYGNLVGKNNVTIGGAGTTSANPASPTQASSVTNTSGSIEAGTTVSINAATLTNTIAAPVQVHQNYGTGQPFSGCGQNCEAYIDVQSAQPATITANGNVNLHAGTFSNTGSLVTALNNVTINATSSALSSNQYLNAYWTGNPAGLRTWGCLGDASTCQNLYGGAYSPGDAQTAPGLPSNVGLPNFVPGTIQAGSMLAVNSPTLTNSGNVIGQNVNLTGAQLVNGITNPNVFTPPPAISGQVIALGPPAVPSSATTTINAAGQVTNLNGQPTSVTGAAGLPANTPIGTQTVGKPIPPSVSTASAPAGSTVATVAGQTKTVTYLTNNPATQVISNLSPAALLSALPASLQPSITQFYYDPYSQAQQVEQAALQATGKSSFYSTTSATDSTSQASINNQDTQALYGAALQYAEQHNVALGSQLSQAQLAMINAPMLWYVEQTVPEPGCSAIGGAACPTVQALMPEVLLPENYAAVNADGEISGANVALNYSNSILNTGSISASNTLTVDTGSLTNEQRSTNIGTIYQTVEDGVVMQTTGTVVQQGGFMSAANMQINAQSIAQIGGVLQQVNADGGVNAAATSELLSNLKNQLGGSFTQSTVSDHLNSESIVGDSLFDDVFMTVVMGSLSIAASMTIGPVAGGMLQSTMSQLNGGQAFNFGDVLKVGAVSYLTAGLTDSLGLNQFSTLGSNLVSSDASVTLANLGNTALAIGEQSVVNATVSTAIQGGSFLTNLRNSAVADLAAVGANAIGTYVPSGTFANVVAHAALGCASSAALGTGCAGGAIGGATSAALTPYAASAITGGNLNVTPAQAAAIAAFATFAGGATAGLAGQNASAGMLAAQNEAINNCLGHPETCTQLFNKAATSFVNNVSFALNAGSQVPAMDSAASHDVVAGVSNTLLNVLSNLSLPGTPDFVPYFQYNNPTIGALGELFGSMAMGMMVSSAMTRLAATSSNPVVTEANTAFFWSGRTNGVGGQDIAAQIAQLNGGTTLETLIAQNGIQMPAWDASNPAVVQAWQNISSQYAAGASGSVRAVIGSNLRPGNVWETAELPALMNNPKVTQITTIDPATGASKIIFTRGK